MVLTCGFVCACVCVCGELIWHAVPNWVRTTLAQRETGRREGETERRRYIYGEGVLQGLTLKRFQSQLNKARCQGLPASVSASVSPTVWLSVWPSVCLSVALYVSVSVCLSVYPFVCLPDSLSLSICLSTYHASSACFVAYFAALAVLKNTHTPRWA